MTEQQADKIVRATLMSVTLLKSIDDELKTQGHNILCIAEDSKKVVSKLDWIHSRLGETLPRRWQG